MRIEPIEVYSDATNAAIMRHPGRRFPGLLVQGDTLHAMSVTMSEICSAIDARNPMRSGAFELRDQLKAMVEHYRKTLTEHRIELPYIDRAPE